MISKILELVGNNSTGTSKIANEDICFNSTTLSTGINVNSFYTYKKGVYVLDDEGMDNDFNDYSEADQILIYNSILKQLTK